VGGEATAGRRPAAAHGEGAGDRLDPITAAKPGDKGVRESRIGKIKSDRIVDDANASGRRGRPTPAPQVSSSQACIRASCCPSPSGGTAMRTRTG
jgi:hypothetical protein